MCQKVNLTQYQDAISTLAFLCDLPCWLPNLSARKRSNMKWYRLIEVMRKNDARAPRLLWLLEIDPSLHDAHVM